MAADLTRKDIGPEDAQEIYDEYDIAVDSDTPKMRATKLGRLMSELNKIPQGKDGAHDFEEWCLKVIRIVFSAGLRNVARRRTAPPYNSATLLPAIPGNRTFGKGCLRIMILGR